MNLSILIPVYGHPDLARIAILSASQYLGVVDEIRVLDDKPQDPFIRHHPDVFEISDRIKYEINPINRGRTSTYNQLVQSCTSDLFLMLDGDDYLADAVDFIELISEFEADSELTLACGCCREVFENEVLKTSCPTLMGRVPGIQYFLAWIGVDNLFPHSACIIKRDAAIRCLGYPPNILNSDIALLRSLLLEGNALVVNVIVSYWRFHGNNASKLAEPDVLLQNLDSILIPYKRVSNSSFPIALWLIRNIRVYVISAFHQIIGAGGVHNFRVFLDFQVSLIRHLSAKNAVALIGVVAALPKLLALILLRQMLGHRRFAQTMANRGNYVYINKGMLD